jgi:hypothetical protein
MVFDHIEKLKRQYTDKYVLVDASRPELARFKDVAGLVKTVNMSGRALVEFDQYANTGWYDIELDFLRVVDKPPPKPEAKEEKPAKAAAPAKAATPVKPKAEAASAPAAAPAPGGKMSTADIIAAARAKAAAGGGAAPAAPKPAAPAPKPAAPAPKPASAAAPAPGAKLSTADILAAARRKAGGATESAAAAPVAPAAPAKPAKPAPEPEATVVESAPAVAPKKSAAAGPKPTTTAEKIAWCRAHDAKGA